MILDTTKVMVEPVVREDVTVTYNKNELAALMEQGAETDEIWHEGEAEKYV